MRMEGDEGRPELPFYTLHAYQGDHTSSLSRTSFSLYLFNSLCLLTATSFHLSFTLLVWQIIRPPNLFLFTVCPSVVKVWRWDRKADIDISLVRLFGQTSIRGLCHRYPSAVHWWGKWVPLPRTCRSFPLQAPWFGSFDSSLSSPTSYQILSPTTHCMTASGKAFLPS